MDRRLFLLSAFVGLAAPQAPASLQPPPSTGGADVPIATSGDEFFDGWLQSFYDRALRAGWPRDLLTRELAGLAPDPAVVSLDTRQPEFSKPVGDYIKAVVSDERIAAGKGYRESLDFWPAIEPRFGVPRDILIAIWAMETAFGAIQGDFDVIRSVASLAAAGRRRDFAEAQLFAALRILSTTPIKREQLKGSWAGAMGQTQFIPETYLASAVDIDGDGKKDIWGSSADALGSAGNLLAKGGWKAGEGWHREIALRPGFDYSLAEGARHSPLWWVDQGARPSDGGAWSEAEVRAEAGLILPAGWSGPAFLVFPNHFAIRRYNNSTSYALAVGMLADRFVGGMGVIGAWPMEPGLSAAERMSAQAALAKLGFDPGAPDGVIGTNTRASLRQWQKARGLPADGYLSADMVLKLMTEAAAL